jgi:hypothetical protein
MSTLYLEPSSGLSGDMLLAALLDLADPRFSLGDLEALAEGMLPGECTLSLETAWRGNLSGKLLTVRTDESSRPPHRGYADLARIVDGSSLSAGAKARSKSILRRIAVAEAPSTRSSTCAARRTRSSASASRASSRRHPRPASGPSGARTARCPSRSRPSRSSCAGART